MEDTGYSEVSWAEMSLDIRKRIIVLLRKSFPSSLVGYFHTRLTFMLVTLCHVWYHDVKHIQHMKYPKVSSKVKQIRADKSFC